MNPLKQFSWLSRLPLALVLLCVPGLTHAHDPGLSTATARFHSGVIEITLAIAVRDADRISPLDSDGDRTITSDEFTAEKPALEAAALDEFIVKLDGEVTRPATIRSSLDSNSDALLVLSVPLKPWTNLTFESKLLNRLPSGHRQFFTLQAQNGRSLAERLLGESGNSFTIQVASVTSAQPETHPAGTHSFADFLALGVKHILAGYDHLLFLFALMVVTSRVLPALQIITCFTLAHSITLAVATLSLVQIPSRIVEPLIAASIVYVGTENLFRGDDPKGRWLLTFAFGLIHGFGFASVLRELGGGSNGGGIALPLVSFNLGVELGQIMVAAIALPVIWKLRTHPVFCRRWVPAGSVLVALLGVCWFVQRVWPG